MDSDKELFLIQNCFSQEVVEPHFSMGCIIGQKGNDLNPQILFTKIWRKCYPRKKSRKDRHPRKTSAGRITTAIVDDKELQKRKASQRTQNTRTNTSWVVRLWLEWPEERNVKKKERFSGRNHWRQTIPQVGPQILNIIDKLRVKLITSSANFSSKFARKKTQEIFKLWHVYSLAGA